MAIDASIALGVKPIQIENPMNQMAAMYQLRGAQQTNQLNQMKMAEAQRAQQEQEGVRNYLRNTPDFDPQNPTHQSGLMQVAPTTAPKILESFLTAKKTSGEIKKTGVETSAASHKLEVEKVDRALKDIGSLQSPEDALAGIDRHLKAGDIDEGKAVQLRTSIANSPDFQSWQLNTLMGIMDAKDKLTMTAPKPTEFRLGSVLRTIDTNPRSPTYKQKVLEDQEIGQDANNKATNARMAQEGRLNRDAQTNPNVVASTVTDETGVVTHYNKFGARVGTPEKTGKPSATFEKTKAARAQQTRDISLAIPELEAITKDGGLIDQSTGSGAGRAYDAAAGFFGQAPEGAIAIGKLKPIADMALKMVPRFEGPQSDKDTQSYKEAAGQLADPTLPTIIRKNAGKEVLRIMKARKNQFASAEMAAEGVSPSGVDASNPLLK